MKDDQRPVYDRFAEPQAIDGAVVVEVLAAALTGLDKVVARRVHYVKMPDGPFVLGREGVARRGDGRRIYFNLNAPVAPFGSMAERTLIDPRYAFAIPTVSPTTSRQRSAMPDSRRGSGCPGAGACGRARRC
jgi:NADPH2:quinone reductase